MSFTFVDDINDTATKEDCRDKCLANDNCEVFVYTAEVGNCILAKSPSENMMPLRDVVTGLRENCD